MHHLPRFFLHSKDQGRMDRKKNPRKPRLERRNAVKNFDYDATPSSSSSSSSPSTSSSSLITRSLDLDRTSFRVEGNEGEFESMCRSLGLSGADDFTIPAAAWEAWKMRSTSDLLPRSRLNRLDSLKMEGVDGKESEVGVRVLDNASDAVAEIGNRFGDSVRVRDVNELIRNERAQLNPCGGGITGVRVLDDASEVAAGIGNMFGDTVRVRDVTGLIRNEPAQLNACRISRGGGGIKGVGVLDNASEGVAEIGNRFGDTVRVRDVNELIRNEPAQLNACAISCGGGGIKGVRPPVLRPPPSIKLPVIDNSSSTWDIFRGFAPKGDRGSSVIVHVGIASFSDEEEEVDGAVIREEEEMRMRPRETALLSESYSFTTSNDDDSSSTTTDPMWNSPDGKLIRHISYWERGELLGRGSFGSVYEGIADDGFFFAVKEVSLLDQGSQGKQSVVQLEQEIALLSQFEHENIVQYYGTDKDESKLYIFLELVTKGSLQSLYLKYNLRDSQVSAYTRQILHGLKYLHDRNVIHRDIKCANILVDASGSVKLADFGLAKATKLNDVKSCKGTAFWMAPEVVKSKKNQGYGLPADIWSLGCTVLEMLTREVPYSHLECQMQALYRIGNGEPPLVPDTLSKDAQDFILQCLKVEPSDRPTAAQLLDHPFVKRPLTSSSGSASPYLGRRF